MQGPRAVVSDAHRDTLVVQKERDWHVIPAGKVSLYASINTSRVRVRVDAGFGYWAVLLPTMLLIGTGFALAFPSLNIAATNGVQDHEQGLASGLVNTSFQIGGALVLVPGAGAVVGAGIGALVKATEGTGITREDLERIRYDAMDDMLATTGHAFLALTVGCARCHDHKFDQVTMARMLAPRSASTGVYVTPVPASAQAPERQVCQR